MSAFAAMHAELMERARMAVGSLLSPGEPCALVDFPCHSNVGDSAIWLGERELLRWAGTPVVYTCDLESFSEQDLRSCLPDGTILIHGGGNFGDLWPHHQVFRERLVAAFPGHRIIQLPQSIHFEDRENLRRAQSVLLAHPDFTLCARDLGSYEAAATLAKRRVLSPDLAFATGPIAQSPGSIRQDIVWLAREDHESAGQPAPELGDSVRKTDWIDEAHEPADSRAFLDLALGDYSNSHGCPRGIPTRLDAADRLAAARVSRGCRLLASGRTVITDRLHGHILSLLLGLSHILVADRTGKIAETYRSWTAASPLARWARTPAEALAEASSVGKLQLGPDR
ncbi:MAG: polysaccharide pyruvyl transferase family protein [Actinomycetota bacterium]|nr:polysaccharide pyruvyl transferase family protein [Actinomycetota bacterium]